MALKPSQVTIIGLVVIVILFITFVLLLIVGAWYFHAHYSPSRKPELPHRFIPRSEAEEPSTIINNFVQPIPKLPDPELIEAMLDELGLLDLAATDPEAALGRVYQLKLANPSYVEWKSRSGLPAGIQEFEEEVLIKYLRSELAHRAEVPEGASIVLVPRTSLAPEIDGRIEKDGWEEAASISIGVDGKKAVLRMKSDGEFLYLACDAIDETTSAGFDQFRFYFHVGLADLIVNERIHVGRNDKPARVTAIRQTEVRWSGDPPKMESERWKKYPISDWNVLEGAYGASHFDGHRQYEAAIHLEEAGLPVDVPFAAYVEVESDPVKDASGTRTRTYLGRIGSELSPVWFQIMK